MSDEVDLNFVIDLRFTGIEAALFIVLQHLEAVEHQFWICPENG